MAMSMFVWPTLIGLILYAAMFFATSAIVYSLWNSCVQVSFGANIIQTISFVNAMGLTFFFWILFHPAIFDVMAMLEVATVEMVTGSSASRKRR